MKRHPNALLLGSLSCVWLAAVSAQQPVVPAPVRAAADRITTEQVKADLDFLASDALKGRNTPSPGFDAAAEYIEKRLQRAGVKPLGDSGTYRQHYVMRETTLTAAERRSRSATRSFAYGEGFTARVRRGADTEAGAAPSTSVMASPPTASIPIAASTSKASSSLSTGQCAAEGR